MPSIPRLLFALALLPALPHNAGGWSVVTVKELPDHAVAGRPLHRPSQRIERGAEFGQQSFTIGVEMNRLMPPLEQRVADMPLERLDPSA